MNKKLELFLDIIFDLEQNDKKVLQQAILTYLQIQLDEADDEDDIEDLDFSLDE